MSHNKKEEVTKLGSDPDASALSQRTVEREDSSKEVTGDEEDEYVEEDGGIDEEEDGDDSEEEEEDDLTTRSGNDTDAEELRRIEEEIRRLEREEENLLEEEYSSDFSSGGCTTDSSLASTPRSTPLSPRTQLSPRTSRAALLASLQQAQQQLQQQQAANGKKKGKKKKKKSEKGSMKKKVVDGDGAEEEEKKKEKATEGSRSKRKKGTDGSKKRENKKKGGIEEGQTIEEGGSGESRSTEKSGGGGGSSKRKKKSPSSIKRTKTAEGGSKRTKAKAKAKKNEGDDHDDDGKEKNGSQQQLMPLSPSHSGRIIPTRGKERTLEQEKNSEVATSSPDEVAIGLHKNAPTPGSSKEASGTIKTVVAAVSLEKQQEPENHKKKHEQDAKDKKRGKKLKKLDLEAPSALSKKAQKKEWRKSKTPRSATEERSLHAEMSGSQTLHRPGRTGMGRFKAFTSARDLLAGDGTKKKRKQPSNIDLLLKQQQHLTVGFAEQSQKADEPRHTTETKTSELEAMKRDRSSTLSTSSAAPNTKMEQKLKKLKKKLQEKSKELKDTLITKEAERMEKEQLSKQLKEVEEAMAQMKTDSARRENLDAVLREVQAQVQSEGEFLRQRLAEEEKKEEQRKALTDSISAQLEQVYKLRNDERASWEKAMKEAIDSAQEAQKKMASVNEDKVALEVENRQKENLIDLLRDQVEKLRSETGQHELTIVSLRKQLEEAKENEDEGQKDSVDPALISSWTTEREQLQQQIESLRELLREADESHDRDIEQLRKSFLERQRAADDAIQRELERAERLETEADEAAARYNRKLQDLLQQLEDEEDRSASLQEELDRLKAAKDSRDSESEGSGRITKRQYQMIADRLQIKLEDNSLDSSSDLNPVEETVKSWLDRERQRFDSDMARTKEVYEGKLREQTNKMEELEKELGRDDSGGRSRSYRRRTTADDESGSPMDARRMEELRSKVKQLERDLASAQQELKTAKREAESREEEKQAAIRTQKRLERDLERVKRQLEEEETNVATLQKTNRTLKSDIERVRREADDELTTLRRENRLLQRRATSGDTST